jgi:hypothetical protein
MKTLIQTLTLLFIFIGYGFSQESFKVIKVNGTILLKTSGVSLETGTVFSARDDLVFRTDDATAAVINPQKGRIVLTSRNHDLSSSRTNQMPSMYSIGSRSAFLSEELSIRDLFSGRRVVLGKEMVEVDRNEYPMNDDHFFFLRYNYKGEEINKRLGFSADTLIIDRVTLHTVDGVPIPGADNTTVKLLYRKGNESIFISEFDLIFPDPDQLKKEIGIILSEMSDRSSNEKMGEIEAYLNDFYGKVSRVNLVRWMEENFPTR